MAYIATLDCVICHLPADIRSGVVVLQDRRRVHPGCLGLFIQRTTSPAGRMAAHVNGHA